MPPLARCRLLSCTESLERAPDGVARDHRLNPAGRGTHLTAATGCARLGRVSVGYARHRGPGWLEIYAVPTRAEGPAPTGPVVMRWATGQVHVFVQIDRQALEARLTELIGHPVTEPIRFRDDLDVDSPRVRSWQTMVQTLVCNLDGGVDGAGSLIRHPSMTGSLEQLLVTGLLLAQPHNHTATLAGPARPATPPAVRRAVELINAQPGHPFTIRELAKAAYVSERTLRAGFRQALDTTPMAYLREIRLQRIHADLLATNPGSGVTVSDLAYRWGLHPGRLGALYRQRFDELPSSTLRRRPGQ